jgi:hypothetical protein
MSACEITNRFKRVLQLGAVAPWRRMLMLTVYRQSSCLQLSAHQKNTLKRKFCSLTPQSDAVMLHNHNARRAQPARGFA